MPALSFDALGSYATRRVELLFQIEPVAAPQLRVHVRRVCAGDRTMRAVTRRSGRVLVVLAFSFGTNCRAAAPSLDPVAKALEKTAVGQQVLKLPVRVVDPQGKPVAKAKVIPWALRSSQGHGWWQKGDERATV